MLARQLPGLAGPWRPLATVMAAAALAAPAAAGGAPAAAQPALKAQAALKTVSYRGYSFEVPRSWPVVRLGGSRRTCVRFDVHAVYLGRPAADESCPSLLVGTTQALLIQPGPGSSARSSVEDPVARRVAVSAPRISITATFGSDPGLVSQILSSASLPKATIRDPAPRTATVETAARRHVAVPALSPKVANYHGLGFDACTAPSAAYMSAWRRYSPYRAVGVYLGGSDEACAQPNLTRGWLEAEAAAGWHFIPMYVGPQAEFGELGAHPGHQGRAAANDAVVQAQRLGFGTGTPLYYDMEAYPPGQTNKALRFLTSWTSRLHALGYSSGVYSSSSAAVAALAHQYTTHRYALPDVIFDALWNGEENTADPVLTAGEWAGHRRVHQFAGNVLQAYGRDEINVDEDYLNVKLSGSVPAPPASSGDESG
jgi:hypothetical protein